MSPHLKVKMLLLILNYGPAVIYMYMYNLKISTLQLTAEKGLLYGIKLMF